jgi:hypothetical protein
MGCRDAAGRTVAVDPTPVLGGDLLVNPDAGVIVMRLSDREAVAAARRDEWGFATHDRVCAASDRRRW